MSVKIGYIIGSPSSTSINRAMFDAVKRNAPQGVEFTEIEIKDLPFYSPDHDGSYPEVATQFKAAIADADAVVVVTPTYNDSFSGYVKNAIDWASRPWGQHSFNGKVSAVAAASISPHGGRPGAEALAAVLAFGEAKVLEHQLRVSVAASTYDEDGNFADEALRAEAREFLEAIVGNATR